MGWIATIIFGGIAGWLASKVMNRDADMEYRRWRCRRPDRQRSRQFSRLPDNRCRLDDVFVNGLCSAGRCKSRKAGKRSLKEQRARLSQKTVA